ncbi:hypothetical protein K443DRAFT_111474, partial [Laccaria amethystina LaAM-08-1]
CKSGCAACWLDNNGDGVDTKFTCPGHQYPRLGIQILRPPCQCGDACPTGYNGIHCAAIERCL